MKVVSKQAPPVTTASSWLNKVAVGVLLVGVLAIGLFFMGGPSPAVPSGTIHAATTFHDWGVVPIGGGLLTARIPLDIRGEVQITTLESS